MTNRMIAIASTTLTLIVTLGGCVADKVVAGVGEAPKKVFKYEGSKQCQPGSGVALEAMQQELAKAGVEVICAHKSHDGRMRIQMCGADTGKMNVFEIPANQLEKAQGLGFTSVVDLKGYVDSECPKHSPAIKGSADTHP